MDAGYALGQLLAFAPVALGLFLAFVVLLVGALKGAFFRALLSAALQFVFGWVVVFLALILGVSGFQQQLPLALMAMMFGQLLMCGAAVSKMSSRTQDFAEDAKRRARRREMRRNQSGEH